MHHLDHCEADPRRAFDVNTLGVRHVARHCRESGGTLMHVSTDYVFDGHQRRPYVEDDAARPLNAYGITKLAGEHWIAATAERHVIVRTSGLYGLSPCRAKGRSFVELMLKLADERDRVRVVDDEVLTPTYTVDVAAAMVRLSRGGKYGVFHVTAEGECSWHAFARKVFDLAGSDVILEVADPGEFPAKTPRPKYSVLENARMKAEGLGTLPPWEDGLSRYLASRSESLRPAV
jgi:dTDP-4-dehydrorhamnose reductase